VTRLTTCCALAYRIRYEDIGGGAPSDSDVIQRGLALAPAPLFLEKGGAMTEVRLRDEDSLERALKLFKRKLQKSGLFGELRRRRHYVKPSEARAIKTAAALRRKRKKKVVKSEW
jgi:small subunit ribosomal protein S21